MKKVFCIMVSVVLLLTIVPTQVFAETNNDIKEILTDEFVESSDVRFDVYPDGEYVISLINSDESKADDGDIIISLFYDSEMAYNSAVSKLNDFKKASGDRASGTHSESNWYYGYSLYISSTVHYLTTVSSGITYGKITSVDIACQTNSGTTIDSISIYAGETGYVMGGGHQSCNKTYNNVSNNSTTNFPSTWPYVDWDASVGTSAGAHTTVTIHRGTAAQRSYTLYNNVIG